MKTYARLQNGVVAEFLTTGLDITKLFNPALTWVDVTNKTVHLGWVPEAGGGFGPPQPPPVPAGAAVSPLSLTALHAQLAALQSQIGEVVASMSGATPTAFPVPAATPAAASPSS